MLSSDEDMPPPPPPKDTLRDSSSSAHDAHSPGSLSPRVQEAAMLSSQRWSSRGDPTGSVGSNLSSGAFPTPPPSPGLHAVHSVPGTPSAGNFSLPPPPKTPLNAGGTQLRYSNVFAASRLQNGQRPADAAIEDVDTSSTGTAASSLSIGGADSSTLHQHDGATDSEDDDDDGESGGAPTPPPRRKSLAKKNMLHLQASLQAAIQSRDSRRSFGSGSAPGPPPPADSPSRRESAVSQNDSPRRIAAAAAGVLAVDEDHSSDSHDANDDSNDGSESDSKHASPMRKPPSPRNPDRASPMRAGSSQASPAHVSPKHADGSPHSPGHGPPPIGFNRPEAFPGERAQRRPPPPASSRKPIPAVDYIELVLQDAAERFLDNYGKKHELQRGTRSRLRRGASTASGGDGDSGWVVDDVWRSAIVLKVHRLCSNGTPRSFSVKEVGLQLASLFEHENQSRRKTLAPLSVDGVSPVRVVCECASSHNLIFKCYLDTPATRGASAPTTPGEPRGRRGTPGRSKSAVKPRPSAIRELSQVVAAPPRPATAASTSSLSRDGKKSPSAATERAATAAAIRRSTSGVAVEKVTAAAASTTAIPDASASTLPGRGKFKSLQVAPSPATAARAASISSVVDNFVHGRQEADAVDQRATDLPSHTDLSDARIERLSPSMYDSYEQGEETQASLSAIMSSLAGLTDRIKNINSTIDSIDAIEAGHELPASSVQSEGYTLQSGHIADEDLGGNSDDEALAGIKAKLHQLNVPGMSEKASSSTSNASEAATADKSQGQEQEKLRDMLVDMRMGSLEDYLHSLGVVSIEQLADMAVAELVRGGVRETVAKRLVGTAKARSDEVRAKSLASTGTAPTVTSNDNKDGDSVPLRKGWVWRVDKRTGRGYYYNSITEERRWQLSPSMRAADNARSPIAQSTQWGSSHNLHEQQSDATYQHHHRHRDGSNAVGSAETQDDEEEDLTVQVKRGHWYRCWDESEQWPFYWNEITQETTWDPPPVFQAAADRAPSTGDHTIRGAQATKGTKSVKLGPGTSARTERRGRDEATASEREEQEALQWADYKEKKRLQAIERHRRQEREQAQQEQEDQRQRERRAKQQALLREQQEQDRQERFRQQQQRRTASYDNSMEKRRGLDETYYKEWQRLRAAASPANRRRFESPSLYQSPGPGMGHHLNELDEDSIHSSTSAESHRSSRSGGGQDFRIALDRRTKQPGLKLRKHAQYKGRGRNPNQKTPAGGFRGRPKDYHFHDTSTEEDTEDEEVQPVQIRHHNGRQRNSAGNRGNWEGNSSYTDSDAPGSATVPKARWIPDEAVIACMECDALFDVFNRRHHCRLCGRVVCQGCSPNKMSVKPKHIVQEPVKDETFAQFMARQKFDQERRGFQIVRVCVRCEDLTFDQAQHPLAGLSADAMSPVIRRVAATNSALAEQEAQAARRLSYDNRWLQKKPYNDAGGGSDGGGFHKAGNPSDTAIIAASLRKAVPISKQSDAAMDERAESLIDACMAKDLTAVKELIALRSDINYVDEDGYSPLIYAASANFDRGVKELCRAGANVNHTSTSDGSTALHVAAQNGFLGVVKFLLQQGALIPERDGDLRDDELDEASQTGFVGMSALYLAAQEGHAAVCEAILSARCEVDHVTKEGASSLYIAAKEGHLSVVKLLVRVRASVNRTTAEAMKIHGLSRVHHESHGLVRPDEITHQTPLAIATACGHAKVAAFLEACGAWH